MVTAGVRRGGGRRALLGAVALVIAGALATPSPATFSGPDGLISFSGLVRNPNSLEIFTARPDGSAVTQLTSNPRRISFVSDWSPDGQSIAFDSDRVDVDGRENAIQIYVVNADGSGLIQLTRGPGFHGTPGWSPDGSRLALDADWGDERGLQGIWTIPTSDPDGVTVEEAQRVTAIPKGASFDSEPQFSPDGSSIVFTRFKNHRRSAIHRVNVDGTGLQRLTSWGLNASDPDWSPDGQMVTFDSGDAGHPGSKGDIYVMAADGSGRTRLTDSPRLRKGGRFNLANNPVWSPSGTKIMYTHFLPERTELIVINPDGSGGQVILAGKSFPNKADWGTHP